MLLYQTWSEFFTDFWNTEMVSWDSFLSLLVLSIPLAVLGVRK